MDPSDLATGKWKPSAVLVFGGKFGYLCQGRGSSEMTNCEPFDTERKEKGKLKI